MKIESFDFHAPKPDQRPCTPPEQVLRFDITITMDTTQRMTSRTFDTDSTVRQLIDTGPGLEATMYGPIRDLFINVFGYEAKRVDIDTRGEGGRPDVTVRAPSGLINEKGIAELIDWIVVEAKDERGCFAHAERRERIFAEKSKYIGVNTAWFVMVEPTTLIARPVHGGTASLETDIILSLDDGKEWNEHRLLHHLHELRADRAGVTEQLQKFREGDTTKMAFEKLAVADATVADAVELNRVKLARSRFFKSLRESTRLLHAAVKAALDQLQPEIDRIQEAAREFGQQYGASQDGAYEFIGRSLQLRSAPRGPEESRAHDRDAARLRRDFSRAPYVARLALEGLPEFQSRTAATDDTLHELFATESANLILARVLLLRFFEDHEFFKEKRYLCNGGVDAFQSMREYFEESYTHLLEQAYREGSSLYWAAFDETELDWVLHSKDARLSSTIEWVIFHFSRYDFKTVKGDILSGIYDRFLERDKRKQLGEFFTPPSIARYIVERIGIDENSRVLDPACGSGTFLVEAFRRMIGDDLDRGIADLLSRSPVRS